MRARLGSCLALRPPAVNCSFGSGHAHTVAGTTPKMMPVTHESPNVNASTARLMVMTPMAWRPWEQSAVDNVEADRRYEPADAAVPESQQQTSSRRGRSSLRSAAILCSLENESECHRDKS